MSNAVKVGLFLRGRTDEDEEKLRQKFPGREIQYVTLKPGSTADIKAQIENSDLDVVLLPNEPLIEPLLREGDTIFLLPQEDRVVRLLRTEVVTEEFEPS